LNEQNKVRIEGKLLEVEGLRLTPAGTAAVNAVVLHESSQTEAGIERKIIVEIPVIAIGATAQSLARAPIGHPIRINGFLAAQGIKRRRNLVLHVQSFELLN